MITHGAITREQSVVSLVDGVIVDAVIRGASDVHCEPMRDGLRIRVRIDGVLHDQPPIDITDMPHVLSRLKVLADMDIAQKRMPQDGKFSMTIANRPIDLRVSTFPSLHGEKIVVRILDRATHMMALDQLGFSNEICAQFKHFISQPQGFFLVTGPTGSGKTTTLYAALSELNETEKNIVTLEDPVEYDVPGITQGRIQPDAGFSFEKGIRAVLRQDPDILMVGEIRDKQTARVAIEAALTGHVVLSTLHTNDAPSALVRLVDMGIEPFLINAALTGVLAQRLVRTICAVCREQKNMSDQERAMCDAHGISASFVGRGCAACDGTGYKGRSGLFELLPVTDALRGLLGQDPDMHVLHTQACADGMQTLKTAGAHKVADGIITIQEFTRVIC